MTPAQICAMYAATEADRVACEARFLLDSMNVEQRREYIAGVARLSVGLCVSVTTKKGFGMETKLWALLIPGPDDVWAMPSKEAAEDAAAKHNKAIETGLLAERFCVPKEAVQARVIEWPYSAEEHAEAMESGEPDVFDGYDTETHNA